MPTPPKLSQEKEREAVLVYLCGVSKYRTGELYGVCAATVYNNILKGRSFQWNDPLVESYRETDARNRVQNSAHLVLTFKDRTRPEPTGLIECVRDKPIFENVFDELYQPGVDAVAARTALPEYFRKRHPYVSLLRSVFGGSTWELGEELITTEVMRVLGLRYDAKDTIELRKVFRAAGDTIIDKVREGGLTWGDLKKGIVHDVLRKLTEREQRVIGMRFGIDEYGPAKTLEQVAGDFDVTRERIKQIEAKALRKLRHPSNASYLRVVDGLMTDSDVTARLKKVQHTQNRA